MRSHKPVWLLILALLASACATGSPTPTLVPTLAPSASPTLPLAPSATAAPTPTAIPEVRLEVPDPQEWWHGAVFYEVFVRSFYDRSGDGIGDFNGLVEKLDYLNDGSFDFSFDFPFDYAQDASTGALSVVEAPVSFVFPFDFPFDFAQGVAQGASFDFAQDAVQEVGSDLGVQALWLMPVFPSPSYHGYDVSDYTTVNPEFGSLDDFRRLLDAAHARGLRVILDLPINHTSTEIAWFQAAQDPASPYRDWYVWSEEDPGVRGPQGQQVWHPAEGGGYYYGYFASSMPDLNFNNPEVREEIKNIARFWLEEMGVDGFRLDGARYYVEEGDVLSDTAGSHAWLKELRIAMKAVNPQAVLVGEVWAPSLIVSEYLQGDELDLSFDFDQATASLASARTGSASSALGQLKLSTRTTPAWRYASFLTNHDQDRVVSMLGSDLEKARRAAAMLLTGPGTPFIYYGEEIGMSGRGSHEAVRTPMQWCGDPADTACFTTGQPWAALQPDAAGRNVAVQMDDPASLLSFYRDLISLRSRYPALQTGQPFGVTADPSSLYALLRAGPEQMLLVLVNLGAEPLEGAGLSLREGPLRGSYQVSVAEALLPGDPSTSLGMHPLTSLHPSTSLRMHPERSRRMPVSFVQPADLQANPNGGFDGYQPLAEIPAGAVIVLQLDPR